MMSVASKTKAKMFTTVVLGFVAALSTLPTWASTTPGMSPITTVTPVVSTSPDQDLSALRIKLKDRFSSIAQDVHSLITTNHVVADEDDVISEAPSVRTFDVRHDVLLQSLGSHQDYFIDIQDDPFKLYINRLADYGVLSSTQKFFPQNYFRVDDFLSLLGKLYKKNTDLSLPSQEALGIVSVDGSMTKGMLQQVMHSLKNINPIDINGNPYDKLIRSEGAYYLVRMFDISSPNSDEMLSAPIGNMFSDIANERFAPAINTLASLGIVNTDVPKFYPDNYIRHYDFVILLVNAYLASKNTSLSLAPNDFQFADVASNAPYLPQLTYALEHGIIDRITMSNGGQLFFEPDKFLTKHDVYHILPKLASVQFVHDDYQADQQKITRAELAELLVASFQLTPKEVISSPITTGAALDATDMSVLMKLKTLVSLL